MDAQLIRPQTQHLTLPGIRRVDLARPFAWLRAGVQDFRRSWPLSLAYGIVIAGLGWYLVNWAWGRLHLAMALSTGFLLVAPFLAIVFYDISHRLQMRHPVPDLLRPLGSLRRNATSIGLYAFMLAFLLSAWERLSAVVVALFLRNDIVTTQAFSLALIFGGEHVGFILAYFAFGALFALAVFALSVVTLPMLIDRKVDVVTAMLTSLWVARENLLPMLVWAALIVVLTGVGYLTWFVGLAVIFPILGHATWHAYRDLVE
jgi:uncharacterized membrane protein